MAKSPSREMPSFVETEFSELIAKGRLEIGDGYRARLEELGGDGPIFLRAGHVTDTHIDFAGVDQFTGEAAQRVVSKMSRPGDVVITTKGNSTGRVAYVDESMPQFVYSPHLSYWRSLDRCAILPGYLRYWSRSEEFRTQLRGLSTSTDMAPYLSLVDQKRLKIRLPDVETQHAVAEILGALDDKIELNRRMNETLEAMARALFKDWFIDFGPVRAKMEGRQPPGLAPEIAALFPDKLDEEGKPEGWSLDTLGEHAHNFDSKRIPLSGADRAKRQGAYPYHGATSVMDHVDDYLFDGVYLLVGEDGSVVKESGEAFTQYAWGKFWVNNHAHVLQGRGAVSTEQLLMYFQHEPVTPFITGAVQLKLSQGRMNSMPFVFPGETLCRKFSEVLAPLFERVRLNADGYRTLGVLRDLLLPRLLSGELAVGDAANLVERVA